MNTVTKAEVNAEHVARLAANIARTAEAIERYVFNKLRAPVTVGDLLAYSRDPSVVAQGVDFDELQRMREQYTELVQLVGEKALVPDPIMHGPVPVEFLGQRVDQVESMAAPLAALRQRIKR